MWSSGADFCQASMDSVEALCPNPALTTTTLCALGPQAKMAGDTVQIVSIMGQGAGQAGRKGVDLSGSVTWEDPIPLFLV